MILNIHTTQSLNLNLALWKTAILTRTQTKQCYSFAKPLIKAVQTMEKNTGIKRLFYATLYSWQGFRSGLLNEPAFLQEFIVIILLSVISFFLDVTAYEQLVMIISLVFILIVEILNSAIECVVDRIGPEHHILSGRAKDYGSLAVLLSLFVAIAVWATILF